MPGGTYDSKAQQRLMHAKAERGEISQETIDDRDKNTDFSHLPERSHSSKAKSLREHLRKKKHARTS